MAAVPLPPSLLGLVGASHPGGSNGSGPPTDLETLLATATIINGGGGGSDNSDSAPSTATGGGGGRSSGGGVVAAAAAMALTKRLGQTPSG